MALPVVESSVDKVALNEQHKKLLKGISEPNLPNELELLD
jgi:hypothetical protein